MLDAHSIGSLARRIKGEYLEMPGLSLTHGQAQRLWNMDALACREILEALVDLQFLRRTSRGSYVRRDASASRGPVSRATTRPPGAARRAASSGEATGIAPGEILTNT
jgi:hypothetical protein